MAKRRISPERREQRKKLLEMLQEAGINDVSGVQNLFKEMVSTVLENGLEAEMEDELGYSKYDYRNKETDNSRNGYSEKTIKTSLGDMDISIPRDRKSHRLSKNSKQHSPGTSKKRFYPCMPRE